MEIKDLKLLVLGIGSIGRRHSDVLYSDLGCKNIILWDPMLERAREHAAKYPGMSVAATLEDGLAQKPDAVFVTSPPARHMEQAAAALRAGCHVMIEKPLSISRDGVDEVQRLAREKGLMVSVALCNRYHSGMQRVRQIVDSGVLGKLINIRSTMCEFFPESRPDYRETYYVQYSGCFELIHAVDYTVWMAGGKPVQVCGICGSDADLGFYSPDNAEMLFRTDTGVTCSVNLGFYRFPGKAEICLYGAEGSCELIYTHDAYDLRTYTRDTREWAHEHVDGLFRNMMFQAEDREFLESIVSGVYSGCSVEDAARSLEIYCQVYGDANPPPAQWR